MRRLHRYDRLLAQRMERRAQQHMSPAQACAEPSQPAHKKTIPVPTALDAGIPPGGRNTASDLARPFQGF